MISRALYFKPSIDAFIKKDSKLAKLKLSDVEWDKAKLMMTILRPFKVASVQMQGASKPGIDKVFFYYEALFDDIDKVKVNLLIVTFAYIRLDFSRKLKRLESENLGSLLLQKQLRQWHIS